ncbi:uncharacterized protein ARMOST_06398 [Armillaria ostoyae]|uniref:Uncharacterized protein n=1 Tax=Armillaria ostoyae TaxID=47428 RepID=A0A284R2W9_ARMOS|nr:uncharacterized protein ARMOST_06398 [Armillaria ostoyae]
MVFVVHIWGYFCQKQHTRESVAPETEKIDIYDHGYARRAWFYIFCGILGAIWQTTVYWLMGAMSNDLSKLAFFVGFYKPIQLAGAAGMWFVYNNLVDVQELLDQAHNQSDSQPWSGEEADREDDSVDEMGNVTPIRNITATEREIAATSLIQRVYRKALSHRQGVAKGGITGLRAQVYASCTKEISRLGDNPGIYFRLFLGPLPYILVCLETVRVDTISHKMKAKDRLKTCGPNEVDAPDDLLTRTNKANKAAVNLQNQLCPSSAFHKRRDIKQLRKLLEEAGVLVSSLPFDTSSDLSDDLHLAIKGIVTERSSTSAGTVVSLVIHTSVNPYPSILHRFLLPPTSFAGK